MFNHPSSAAVVRLKRADELAKWAGHSSPAVVEWLSSQTSLTAEAEDVEQDIAAAVAQHATQMFHFVEELFELHSARLKTS
jgi:hypothetical protein